MPPIITSDTLPTGTKKKSNKKKKSTKSLRSNGEPTNAPNSEDGLPIRNVNGDGDLETESEANTPLDAHFPTPKPQTNGHTPKPAQETTDEPVESNAADTTDASSRFEALSQEREALRIEVEQYRKSLEDIQGKHRSEISSMESQHSEALSTTARKYSEEVDSIKTQHAEEISTLKDEISESEKAREQAEQQYKNLLERVGTIRATLGERLKADKQLLAEAHEECDELKSQNEDLKNLIRGLESNAKQLEDDANESQKELSSLRNRHNLSQQNWVHEREDLIQQIAQLKDEADAAKEAMGDWEVLAMEERSMREGLTERIADIEEQFAAQKEAYEMTLSERDSQSQTVDGLQIALAELQEARRKELRDMVESYEEQLRSLTKQVQESDAKATEASATKEKLEVEIERLAPLEKEVKDKTLLCGKLRHEGIILNEHLTKALKKIKTQKPDDTIDRQLVTNHFLQFLALDRSDPKKFQILQIFASLLNWTDEQREQAGLARPGAGNSSLRLPGSPFFRTPSTPSLSSEFLNDIPSKKSSLGDLWGGFSPRVDEGSVSGSRSGSVSSARPETRSGENTKE